MGTKFFDLVTLTLQVDLLKKKELSWTKNFESEGLLIVAIYIWLPPASYVVFSDNSGYIDKYPKVLPFCEITLCKSHGNYWQKI